MILMSDQRNMNLLDQIDWQKSLIPKLNVLLAIYHKLLEKNQIRFFFAMFT